MKVVDFIFMVFFLGAMGVGLYAIWLYLPGEKVVFTPVSAPSTTVPSVPASVQFYPFMRFSDSQITYYIYPACNKNKEDKVISAFSTLESSTLLRFIPTTQEDADLEIFCSNIAPVADERNHFVAGEGGPSKVINTSLYYVILHGKVSLYRDDPCDESKVALHEILHALGFDHSQNSLSIMYPITNCKQQLDQYIIDSINEMYALPSLPDLTVLDATATTQGRYLSFHVTVANLGLRDARNAILSIESNGESIKEFDLENIAIGTKKYLDVQNVRLPSTLERLSFHISMNNDGRELTLKNNELALEFSAEE